MPDPVPARYRDADGVWHILELRQTSDGAWEVIDRAGEQTRGLDTLAGPATGARRPKRSRATTPLATTTRTPVGSSATKARRAAPEKRGLQASTRYLPSEGRNP